ncbi:MAG: hypothetical protein IPK93_06105 [Solirubrobacterales bacterium]|nr:hypothetical protein [Solirubrobacterales bacterium]
MPGPLLPAAGFAAIIAAGGLITCFSGLAHFTTSAIAALAVAGFVTNWPFKNGRSISIWPVIGAALVFFVYGAPVIFSGDATFAGYVKLDDTSTWLAFTDHVLTYGHSTAGIPPSSYEATVQINLSAGYPLGSFIPLAVGHETTGQDSAWLFQPYLALMAAMMSLVFFELVKPIVNDVRIRSAAVFIAAQPALLVGYSLWGGIKEVATALIVSVLAATAIWLIGPGGWRSIRSTTPGVIVSGAALIGVMGAGGAPWLVAVVLGVVLLMAARLLWQWRSPDSVDRDLIKTYLARAAVVIGGVVLIGLPTVLAAGQLFSPNQGPLTNTTEMGNLIKVLSVAQFAGPWPVGDFRIDPDSGYLTFVLIATTVIAWIFGIWASVKSRAWGLLLFAFGCGLGSFLVWYIGSPWIQGKALATGTASFLVIAMAGIVALVTPRDWIQRGGSETAKWIAWPFTLVLGCLLLVVPVGVLASNALQYHEAYLAPRGQLAELSDIGGDFAGQGPTLMTEYQAYGVRHFLRLMDAEGASELRRRQIPRRDGTEVEKGAWSDTDELELSPDLEGLLTYRTLVLRRSPGQSRPPSPYELVKEGDYYEVWQRPEDFDPAEIIAHVPLGNALDPAAVPTCNKVRSVAAKAGPGGRVAAVTRAPNGVGKITTYPDGWIPDPANGTVTPTSDGTASATIDVPSSGEYDVFVGGSARGKVTLGIGGIPMGSIRNRLNNNAQYIEFGKFDLGTGPQEAVLKYEQGGALRPATGGYPFGLGPVVVSPVRNGTKVTSLPASQAGRLCGQRLDWIEALR